MSSFAGGLIAFDAFVDELIPVVSAQLEHEQPRVRVAVAALLGALCERRGVAIYRHFRERLTESIRTNFVRTHETLVAQLGGREGEQDPKNATRPSGRAVWASRMVSGSQQADTSPEDPADFFQQQMASAMLPAPPKKKQEEADSTRDVKPTTWRTGVSVAVDDTSGWAALETSLNALCSIIRGCGASFLEAEDGLAGAEACAKGSLFDLVVNNGTRHINRHVKAASFDTSCCIIEACAAANALWPFAGEGEGGEERAAAASFGDNDARLVVPDGLAEAIAGGLADNWSQVRYASSVTCRAFMMALPPAARARYQARLLPRMCFNRHYVAEGVRVYSQETWRVVMGEGGTAAVAAVAGEVTAYYTQMCDADNHCVRESACHCVAELAARVAREAVAPHVARLLQSLLACFQDESWPVRDAACIATGRFVRSFPAESEAVVERLYELWFEHLSDQIWSVREDAAVALGDSVRAYGDSALQRVLAKVREMLPCARDQPAETAEQAKARQNDAKAHTGTMRFSCGSLAPKLKKGGCSDCQVNRPKEPWEASDGAIYMVRELCEVSPESVAEFMPHVADLGILRHFPQADSLRETIWKQLPVMAERLGKRPFKRYLELFLDPLFMTLHENSACSNLAMHAAGGCASFLSRFLGPTIFRGRLDPEQQRVIDTSPFVRIGGGMMPPAPGRGSGGLRRPPSAALSSLSLMPPSASPSPSSGLVDSV